MWCPKCGAQLGEGARFCGLCGQDLSSHVQPAPVPQPRASRERMPALLIDGSIPQYAGFWRRLAAYVLDGMVIAFFLGNYGLLMSYAYYTRDYDVSTKAVAIALAAIALLFVWAYFSCMESSRLQATLGKMAAGIYVTDLDGKRISFARASGRFFGKILSAIVVCAGYVMAGFTEKRQALHDQLAGCLVLWR